MRVKNLKKNIHTAIDKIEDKQLLEAVYTILEKQAEYGVEYTLTDGQKKELDQRLEDYNKGVAKTQSWDDVKKSILKRKK